MFARHWDSPTRGAPLERRLRRLTLGERVDEAAAFLRRFHRETRLGERACRARVAEAARGLRRRGAYRHTPDELEFGARLAWRNHPRCIGRLPWESLEVVDRRDVADADGIADEIARHMGAALGDGRIRSMITIFAPVEPGRLPAHVESPQITAYAGYLLDEGRRLGDAQNIEATRTAVELGWRRPDPPGAFDRLPVVLRDAGGRRLLYEMPEATVREVPIAHPEAPAVAALGLRWYAVPCVSDMILTIGGIDYPCAPFNGYYMCTEIASRNLADAERYDLLPRVAEALGLDARPGAGDLWKDAALTELNRAVLASFAAAGVTMIDHHAASRQHMAFAARERARGREPSADWAWIVPPQASAACPVFHVAMRDLRSVPAFYRSRALDGAGLRPCDAEEERNRLVRRLDRLRRRWRRWLRERAER